MRLILFDFLEVKWLNSHIFMSNVDARMQIVYKERKEMHIPTFSEVGQPFHIFRTF